MSVVTKIATILISFLLMCMQMCAHAAAAIPLTYAGMMLTSEQAREDVMLLRVALEKAPKCKFSLVRIVVCCMNFLQNCSPGV